MSEFDPVIEFELYLIRHGETFSNAAAEECLTWSVKDREDPFLTEKGERQAELVGERFADIPLDAVYSSCLRRAVQTANEIIKRQPEKLPLYMHPVFTECGMSEEYKGCSPEELRGLCPSACFAEGVDPEDGIIMRDDPFADEVILGRAAKAVDYLKSRYKNGEKVAVVLHAAFVTHVVYYLLGFKEKMPDGSDIAFANTGVTRVTFYKDGTYRFGNTVFSYINDVSHLGGL